MIIERVLSPVHSLGPGERVCLWVKGCSKNCEGCISPEMQDPHGRAIDDRALGDVITQIARRSGCRGLTVSGGDPLEQPQALLPFLERVRDSFDDILVYTGYELSEIMDGAAGEMGIECLRYIDVLIDGRYKKSLNTPDCVLRGSSNQKIHFINKEIKPFYDEYMRRGRIVESFVHDNVTVITGILNEEAQE